jgi:hypothetical protein
MREAVSGPYHDHLLNRDEVEEFDPVKKSGYFGGFPGQVASQKLRSVTMDDIDNKDVQARDSLSIYLATVAMVIVLF